MDQAPENTQSAFEMALTHSIDGIELDVQMTGDGVLVIHHDPTLERTTGQPNRLAECLYDDLVGIDWGGWFSESFRDERIATLEETVRRFAARTRLLIEIKSFPEDQYAGRSLDITSRVVSLLQEAVPRKAEDNILILSFDPDVLDRARDGAWPLVLNIEDPSIPAHVLPKWAFAYSASIDTIDRSITKRWHDLGKRVMTWSCNTPEEIDKANDIACDVIMTDRPGWAVAYQNSKRRRP